MKRLSIIALIALPGNALAEGPVLNLPDFPDYMILGTGTGPAYIGADDRVWAVVPAARKSFDERYLSLEANYLSANLLNHPNWRVGPAGILRFGRSDVSDNQVARLPEIDMSIDLGAFAAYEVVGDNPRNRTRVGVGVLQDVTDVHQGYVLDADLRRWLPVGSYGAFGIGVAASWASEDYMDTYFSIDPSGAAASGLPTYAAGSGWRDVRVTAIYVQPVSEKWAVGAGMMYSHLLSKAANSPSVSSERQIFAGVGIARAW